MTNKKQINRRKLARQLSAIMNNPETPTEIYEAISDALLFYSSYLDYRSVEIDGADCRSADLNSANSWVSQIEFWSRCSSGCGPACSMVRA